MHDDTVPMVRAAMETHGLKPTPEEMAMYVAMAPILREMTERLHAVEVGEDV